MEPRVCAADDCDVVFVPDGGSSNIENIALSCAKCNQTKGTKTHEEFLEEVTMRK